MAALPNVLALDAVLARGDVWRGDTLASLPMASLPSGFPVLDEALPGQGWPRGNLTEILVDRCGQGELTLVMPALARLSAEGGWVALVAPPWLPHAPAWQMAGLLPERLVVVQPGKALPWCVEQLLVCGGFSAVLAWPGEGMDTRSLRRLQVAAEGQAVFALLWRSTGVARQPSPAPLRVQVSGDEQGLSVAILKRRGRPASRPLLLAVPRPGRRSDVVAGPAFSLSGARSPAVSAIA
ncbi:MAG: translesion DNA synthesis-associated protein ImuA [Azonexus sp.]|nr:translesion DNA synthesis-associated protein ImuA [Azonexus sp.]